MVVRADALATPVTQFESDRLALQRAIDETQPGAAVLNIGQALSFAEQTQKLHAQRAGDIVFVGAGRIPADAGAAPSIPPEFPADLDQRSERKQRHPQTHACGGRRTIRTPGTFLWP